MNLLYYIIYVMNNVIILELIVFLKAPHSINYQERSINFLFTLDVIYHII